MRGRRAARVTGASRTGDIGGKIVMGAHGRGGLQSFSQEVRIRLYLRRMQLCMQRVKATSQLGDPLVEMRHWLYSFLQPDPQAPAAARWLVPMPTVRTAKPTISAQFSLRPSTFVLPPLLHASAR